MGVTCIKYLISIFSVYDINHLNFEIMKRLIFALIPLFMLSCMDKQASKELETFKAQQALQEKNKSIIRNYWDGKWNERRPEILDELLTKI